MLKTNLLVKKFTNLTGKLHENYQDQECEIFRVIFLYDHKHIGGLQICINVPIKNISDMNHLRDL